MNKATSNPPTGAVERKVTQCFFKSKTEEDQRWHCHWQAFLSESALLIIPPTEMTNPSVEEENKTMEEPLLSSPEISKGGFRTLPFVVANAAFEKLAIYGLQPNMVLYLTKEYGLRPVTAANILFLWPAATDFMPIVGAFLADSYLGRYPMIGFGCIVNLLGMVLFWLTTIIPQARPSCNRFISKCKHLTTPQLLYLYSCFGLISIGAGSIRSSSMAFGADQLQIQENEKNTGVLESFFSWYNICVSVSMFVAFSCLVYIQDNFGWKVGFGVPAVFAFFSAVVYFMASPFYVKLKTRKSILTGFAQVLGASYKNRDIQISSLDTNTMYLHVMGSVSRPSEKLRFLNKACIIRNSLQDGVVSNPWSVSTVNQVEDLKALIRIIPIWSTGILRSVTVNQSSFIVLQATTMDRHITSNFKIPAGSFGMFVLISIALWLGVFDRIILPLVSKIKGKPVRVGLKSKMGIGIFFSCMAVAVAAMVESARRKRAIEEGLSDKPQAVVNMSAMWLIPQSILIGMSEAFNIGQTEFYYYELPKSMTSIAVSLPILGLSVANLVSSFLLSAIDDITERGSQQQSWVSTNMNKDHYDYYCWLLCGLGVFNSMYYIVCSRAYGPCKGEDQSKELGVNGTSDEC